LILLPIANQERQAARRRDQANSDREYSFKAFDGAHDYDVEPGTQSLGTNVLYIDVGQCERPYDFTEKCGLLVTGLD